MSRPRPDVVHFEEIPGRVGRDWVRDLYLRGPIPPRPAIVWQTGWRLRLALWLHRLREWRKRRELRRELRRRDRVVLHAIERFTGHRR